MATDTPTTSRWRRNRPSANPPEKSAQPAPNMPSASKPLPKLERAASKMSLFNLFSRPKVEKARGHIEVGLAVPMQPPQPPPKSTPVSAPKSSLRLNPSPATQQAHRSRSSQMLRPMSMRPPSVKKEPENWDPPPLFQAYPQAIKYATVQGCIFSPDALLRTQSQRQQQDQLRERTDSHRDLGSILENEDETKKAEKNHKRLVSNSVMNPNAPQLTSKIYVLVTAGYMLQYSGDGSFDRLPEKVLKLGKDSAAFACDLIPGKHWVLQISQSAKEDGTVTVGPKASLLSRLRLQSALDRKAATSLLLVLDSAEEMDTWMTAVRKEIDSLGGMKSRDEAIRESSSTEEGPEKRSQESATSSHRFQVMRDPNRMSKTTPVDSPHHSQYSESPRIVTSDWEGDRSERAVSIADSVSIHSSRHSSNRRSVEVTSIFSTSMSHEQMPERSRYSYVSTATSVSGTGTRNTSRNSSPAPTSPLKESFSPADAEPLRSATSLRSFHMNPSNTITNRRRSMQPLPVTNEDSSLSADSVSVTPQRHSIYGPISPTTTKPEQMLGVLTSPTFVHAPVHASTPSPTSQLAPLLCRPTRNVRYSTSPSLSTQPPVRFATRSSSAPPVRHSTISPPPQYPAPPPGRPQSSIVGHHLAATLSPHSTNRRSQSPKPFLRPFPVRPQAQHIAQHADRSFIAPRRLSSLNPAPIPLGIVVNRSFTAPVRAPSAPPATSTPQFNPPRSSAHSQQLRRPASVQVRSNPAPFLSSSRPAGAPLRAISSTPSFLPGKRASTTAHIYHSPSNPALRQQSQQQAAQRSVTPRRSMPVIGLPPPAPPPNMPLPPPPPIGPPRAIAMAV